MKSNCGYVWWRMIAVSLSLAVVGCQMYSSGTTQTSSLTPVATFTHTLEPATAVWTPSPEPIATATHTSAPTTTATLIPTAIATLPLAEAQAQIEDYLRNNAGCRLPCWWGFTPGLTHWQTAYNILAKFDANIYILATPDNDPYFAEVTIPVPVTIYPTYTRHKYTLSEGIIDLIEVVPGSVPTYSLPQFLGSYGPPTEVWLRTYSQALGEDLPFDTVLFYQDQGILARFPVQGTVVEDKVRGCPSQAQTPVLALWAPNTPLTFSEATNQTVNLRNEETWPYQKLENVTDLDAQTFHDTFSVSEVGVCYETPASFWTEP